MNYSIFLSYRREDSSSTVSSLLLRLQEKFGENEIFADNESIKEGEVWPNKIEMALEQSKIVLVLIGNNWLCTEKDNPNQIRLCSESDWVRKEIETAQKLKKIIIPILADVVEMPDHKDLPESIKILKNIQFSRIKFQPGDKNVVNVFIDFLSQKLRDINSPDEVRFNLESILVKKYQVLKNIGIGSKSSVYLGRDNGLERDVIIKVISNPDFNNEFIDKIRLAAKITDSVPNCISILGAYVDRNPFYVITTFLKKGSLRKMLFERNGKPMPYSNAKKILLNIANSLKQAHDINFTHCNVKPSNIILDDNYDAFLNHLSRVSSLDCEDIIKRLSNITVFSDESAYREELCYLAPEIFDNCPSNDLIIDGYKKIDQYMLGLIGYEMLTGYIPNTLTSVDDLEQNTNKAFKAIRPISSIRTDCPKKFSNIIHRMINKKPEKRYTSLQVVIDEINGVSFDSFEIAKDSFNRCISAKDSGELFFSTFYNRLLSKLPVKEAQQLQGKGIGESSSHRQYDMLRQGLFILLQFGQNRLGETEPNILSTIAQIHNQHNYNISPKLYSAFFEALLDTVGGCPPEIPTPFDMQCSISVDEREIITNAWVEALEPGIKYMKDRY